jgi:hypothetical protein
MIPEPAESSDLVPIGVAVLKALETISKHVAESLGERVHSEGAHPLLGAESQVRLMSILNENRQALRALRREPAIARVEIEWIDTHEVEYLYICRASSAGVQPDRLDGKVVSYRAALGRLAEIPAGEEERIVLPMRRREALVRCRVLLHPRQDASGWDSIDNLFDFPTRHVGVDSIRRLLEHEKRPRTPEIDFLAEIFADESAKQLFFDQRRRKTVDRMELRDQPILDQFQGAIFRLPLSRQVLLIGPPGAGKTTTLIRRLAQKRTDEALSSAELARLTELGLKAELMSDTGWAMFSPTELLKLYVREAFNRESVPASSWNLRTWTAERLTLGRDVFRFLKGASSGRFTLSESDDALLDCKSSVVAALADDLADFADTDITSRCRQAFQWIDQSPDSYAREVAAQIRTRFRIDPVTIDTVHEFAEKNDLFRENLSRLNEQIEKEERSIANELLLPDATERLQALRECFTGSAPDSDEREDEDDDDLEQEVPGIGSEVWDRPALAKTLLRLVRLLADQSGSGSIPPRRGALGKATAWVGNLEPLQEALYVLGRKLRLRKRLRILDNAPRNLVFGIPSAYVRLKRKLANEGIYFRKAGATTNVSSVMSVAEADVVIFVMLRNARRSMKRLPNAPWLQSISARYLMQVLVDEATDFSAVQLACMIELAHPQLRSWFACGDFRQRITAIGISGSEDVEWIRRATGVQELEVQQITAEYRQSGRLKALAKVLAGLEEGMEASRIPELSQDDPAVLLAESMVGPELAAWLAARIIEVERSVGRLPSIAVFVDTEERIDGVVASTATLLAEQNIQIVGCHDGRDVGNAQEVRVFDVRHIKGLEFEAVFFVGVDALAERLPDLFYRYLYVGITRAATFLGITCENNLPPILDPIRKLVSNGNWV